MIVRASITIAGIKSSVSGIALVDAGSVLTLLDEEIANVVGVRLLGKRVRLVVGDGHEIVAELGVVKELIIEGESLPEAHVAITKFSEKIRESLKKLGLADWCIVGLSTLEILGLAPNTSSGRLEKVGVPVL
jgi:predicted aspartyl protease